MVLAITLVFSRTTTLTLTTRPSARVSVVGAGGGERGGSCASGQWFAPCIAGSPALNPNSMAPTSKILVKRRRNRLRKKTVTPPTRTHASPTHRGLAQTREFTHPSPYTRTPPCTSPPHLCVPVVARARRGLERRCALALDGYA